MSKTPEKIIEVDLDIRIVHLSPPGSAQELLVRNSAQNRIDNIATKIGDSLAKALNTIEDRDGLETVLEMADKGIIKHINISFLEMET